MLNKKMGKMRIALVANPNSIHTTRWVNWLKNKGNIVKKFSLKQTSDSIFFGPEPPLDRSLIMNFGNKIRKTTKKLQTLVDDFKPDLVHGCFLTNCGFYASRLTNYPIVVQVMGSDLLVHQEKSWLLSWIVKNSIKNSSLIISPPLLIEKLKRLGITDNQIHSNLIGIDTTLFKPLEKQNTVLFNRGFEEIYNPLVVAEAIIKVSKKNPNIKFFLSGEGALKEKVEQLLQNRNVEFTGQLSEKKMSEIMGISKIVISPSLSDSIPLTAFEAMSCGSILVASDIPAHRQWENYGHPIFFFDKEDAGTLANHILELYNNQEVIDKALNIGPKLVKNNWDREIISKKIFERYIKTINDFQKK